MITKETFTLQKQEIFLEPHFVVLVEMLDCSHSGVQGTRVYSSEIRKN
jgi:hypothetical protein